MINTFFVYIYLYVETGTSLQRKAICSISQKAPVGTHVIPDAIFTLASPTIHETTTTKKKKKEKKRKKKEKHFAVDINPVHSHMASQTCCGLTYIVTEMTQITCRLLRKDLRKSSLRLIAGMTSQSGCRRIDPTTNVTSRFKVESIRDRGRVLFSKCLFQDEVFESPYFKRFTTIFDHLFSN